MTTTAGKPAAAPADDGDELLTQISHAIAALRQVVSCEPSAPRDSRPPGEGQLTAALNIHDLTAAFAGIAQMERIVSNAHPESSKEIARALWHYKGLLSQFKEHLPRIQGWLLAERARLRSKHSHSEAVESWFETSRKTRR